MESPSKADDLITTLNQSIAEIKEKSPEKAKQKVKKSNAAPSLLNPKARNANRHRKEVIKAVPTSRRHQIVEEAGATLKPNLYPSKYFNKIMNRYSNGNVFSTLYQDHIRVNYKRMLQNNQDNETIRKIHNSKERFVSNKVSRKLLKNYIPFYDRYDQ